MFFFLGGETTKRKQPGTGSGAATMSYSCCIYLDSDFFTTNSVKETVEYSIKLLTVTVF